MDQIQARLFSRVRKLFGSGKRKILFVYRFCGLGGVETSTIVKMQALRRFGIHATVLFLEFYGDGARDFSGYPYVNVGLPENCDRFFDNFDAIIVIDYPDFLKILDRNNASAPLVLETHSSIPTSITRFYAPFNDPRVRAIIVPSLYNEKLVREFTNPKAKIVVVPNAVDRCAFFPGRMKPQLELIERLDGSKLVLWVGRLEDEKNPGELIDIAEQLLERISGVRFLVVGDHPGQYEARKSQLIEKMRASTSSAFTFIRTVPHASMPNLFRIVSNSGGLLLSTSRHESLPMTFLEAMASNCPVVSTDVGGVRELISDGSTGRLYRLGDVVSAAATLRELLCNETAEVQYIRSNARRRVRSHHSPKVVALRYKSLLDELIET